MEVVIDEQDRVVQPPAASVVTNTGSLSEEEGRRFLYVDSSSRGNAYVIPQRRRADDRQSMDKDYDGTNDREVPEEEHLVQGAGESYLMNEDPGVHELATPTVARVWAGGATMSMVVGIAAYRARFPTAKHIADHLSGVPGAVPRAVLARAIVKEALERAVSGRAAHPP